MSTKVLVRGPLPRYITIPDGGLVIGGIVTDGLANTLPYLDADSRLAIDEVLQFINTPIDSYIALNLLANIEGTLSVYACNESTDAGDVEFRAQQGQSVAILGAGGDTPFVGLYGVDLLNSNLYRAFFIIDSSDGFKVKMTYFDSLDGEGFSQKTLFEAADRGTSFVLPSLVGDGLRPVMVDANGKLSAPGL